jgi:cohesin loading factor subunit SCC2
LVLDICIPYKLLFSLTNFFSGVSVRKRVVKIFRDVCLSQPNFVRIPDICSRLLRRIHDEESIRKLVLDTFQHIWFTSTRNQYDIRQRVQTIIDVLIDAQKQNNNLLENLVKEFLHTDDKQSNDDKRKMHEQRKDVLKAIQDIINELVESILKIESANDQVSFAEDFFKILIKNFFRFHQIKWSQHLSRFMH